MEGKKPGGSVVGCDTGGPLSFLGSVLRRRILSQIEDIRAVLNLLSKSLHSGPPCYSTISANVTEAAFDSFDLGFYPIDYLWSLDVGQSYQCFLE